jgi:transcriptional regulator with GAF, ATPase, and Fis domain
MLNEEENLILHLNEAIATNRDKETLFKTVTTKLRLIFPFDLIAISIFDAEAKNKRVFLRDYFNAELPADLRLTRSNVQFTPITGSPVELLITNPHLQQADLAEYVDRYPDFEPCRRMWNMGIRYLTAVPLLLANRLTGSLMLGSRRRPILTAADERLLEKLGSLIAVAVANTVAFEDVTRREQERTLQLNINNALLSIKQREPLFRAIAEELARVVPFDYFGIRVQRPSLREGFTGFAEFARPNDDPQAPLLTLGPDRHDGQPTNISELYGQMSSMMEKPGLYVADEFRELARRYPAMRYVYETHSTRAMLIAPLWQRAQGAAALVLASDEPHGFGPQDLETVQALIPQIALALENLFAFEQIEELKLQVEQERTYLIDEINTTATAKAGELIGPSTALQQVQIRIGLVAPTDTTVLVTGETGTGKEMVARALHQSSPRHNRALVKLNCAALPAQLIESELFGHEKGSFTGATERRIGKFELADGGTIFLDEVGELPLDLQAKLLRVLQEKEFERLGGSKVLQTNARVIAATNRVLEDEVRAGRFRADLYYRLNVFPIQLPPLRERPEDIEPLAWHFIQRLSQRMAKPVRQLRPADLAALQAYSWPGNIRELEHVLEQAVIVSQGAYLEFGGFAAGPLLASAAATPPAQLELPNSPVIKTLRDHERDHILAALHRTGGRVSGPQGAAVLLDINAKTLEARMKKLGIRRTVTA